MRNSAIGAGNGGSGEAGTPVTLRTAKTYVRLLGGTLKLNEYGEYVVRLRDLRYFASDLEDAVGTARLIARDGSLPVSASATPIGVAL